MQGASFLHKGYHGYRKKTRTEISKNIDIITDNRYNNKEVIMMKLCDLIQEKNLSIYRLSKNSGIPYATLNDIVNDKARLEKCKAETVYRLAKELDLSMEDLLAPYISKRCDFELFKSNVCHSLKRPWRHRFYCRNLGKKTKLGSITTDSGIVKPFTFLQCSIILVELIMFRPVKNMRIFAAKNYSQSFTPKVFLHCQQYQKTRV